MKTTVDIPENELRDAVRYAKAKTKREAIVAALVEFNRRRRMADLVEYSGTSDTLMSNSAIEALDGACSSRRRSVPRRRGQKP